MADVRSLFRQQRAARLDDRPPKLSADPTSDHKNTLPQQQKRKQSQTDVFSNNGTNDDDIDSRKKRSKPEVAVSTIENPLEASKSDGSRATTSPLSQNQRFHDQSFPPARQTSGTPAHGVEMNIPSRPATPNPNRDAGRDGIVSATSAAAGGRAITAPTSKPLSFVSSSNLLGKEAVALGISETSEATEGSTDVIAPFSADTMSYSSGGTAEINEAEWAAFEAEVVNAPPSKDSLSTVKGDVVQKPAVAGEGELGEPLNVRQRTATESQIENEKEEASRTLELEFEDMEELESRIKRLKEKREALRQHGSNWSLADGMQADTINAQERSDANTADSSAMKSFSQGVINNVVMKDMGDDDDKDDDDDDGEDEDEDDSDGDEQADSWTAFRF